MGTFLSLSGVINATDKDVEHAMMAWVQQRQGRFERATGETAEGNSTEAILATNRHTVALLYPNHFIDWDEASAHISKQLKCPVFSFHIHDGDLWMFTLFHSGDEVAWFNPRPDYWDDIDAEERQKWAGDANAIAARIPGLVPDAISEYFVSWSDKLSDSKAKAYPNDEFEYGTDWQMVDFMKRLDLIYPVEYDRIIGMKYHLEIPDRKTRVVTAIQKIRKPWWKIW